MSGTPHPRIESTTVTWRAKVFRAWPPSHDLPLFRPWVIVADPGNGDLMVADSLGSYTHAEAMSQAIGLLKNLNDMEKVQS